MEVLKPGLYGKTVAADRMREVYNEYNEQLVRLDIRPDLVLLGDSVTERWAAEWYFCCCGLKVANRGIGGDTTEYMEKRLEADVLQLHPQAAVLCGGINDMMSSQDDLWWKRPGRDEKTVTEEICCNMETMSRRCADAGVLPILGTVHLCDLCVPWDNARSDRILNAENRFLKDLAANNGWPLADFASCFMADGEKSIRDYSVDGVHPDWKGYLLMRDELIRCLRRCGILKQ